MNRFWRTVAITFGTLSLVVVLAVVAFELTVVSPATKKAQQSIESATDGERDPPSTLVGMLHSSPGQNLKYLVARNLLMANPSQVANMRTLRRQFTELGLGLSLAIHYSEQELMSIYLSQTYMGPGVHGFDQAAARYISTPLKEVNRTQAAKLVAIAQAPSAYLESPARLEKRIQYLMSQSAE